MDISIVIPLLNEQESLPELAQWIKKVMDENNFTYEIIFIDDGSTDESWQVICNLQKENSKIRGIKFSRNYGKAAALHIGFGAAKGEVVFTMDADLQDDPDELPEMYRIIKDKGYDLVSGWKKKRYDPILSKNLPSKLFNLAASLMSGIKLHDFNCGLKAYKSKVVKSIEIYGDMHRYIPVIAANAGFKKITEKVVQHHKRKYGKTKFGVSRFINGFLDLISITFLSKFMKKPMHFFGTWGTLFFLIGFVILSWLSVEKIFYKVYKITERPIFYFGLLSLLFGSQLFMTGFLGELIARNSAIRNNYLIESEI